MLCAHLKANLAANEPVALCCYCRLRKNLRSLVIAHPTWFIRTVLAISRPFIRSDTVDREIFVSFSDTVKFSH